MNTDTSAELEAYYAAMEAFHHTTAKPGSPEYTALEDAICDADDALAAARKEA